MAEQNPAQISDPNERKVLDALADPQWDFRTTRGISIATGIDENEVKTILAKNADLIRKSPIPDRRGRALYTLSTRSVSAREGFAVAQRAMSKSIL